MHTNLELKEDKLDKLDKNVVVTTTLLHFYVTDQVASTFSFIFM